eukprot:2392279-Pleurochrysis_carterae.AAC.3
MRKSKTPCRPEQEYGSIFRPYRYVKARRCHGVLCRSPLAVTAAHGVESGAASGILIGDYLRIGTLLAQFPVTYPDFASPSFRIGTSLARRSWAEAQGRQCAQ